jgi:hypothetical protein
MTADRPALAQKIRRAAILGGLGLAVQLGAAFHWTPATFILSATIGAPLVLVGGALFLAAVWRNMRDKGAL